VITRLTAGKRKTQTSKALQALYAKINHEVTVVLCWIMGAFTEK